MTNDNSSPDDDSQQPDHQGGQDFAVHRSDARDDVIKLTLVGVILVIVGGLGTWYSKWDTGTFSSVEVADDRTVAVGYQCGADSRVDVDEHDDRVEITLTERPPSDDCDDVSYRCVTLDRPLAGRRVLNAGTDTEVLVAHVENFGGCPAP